MGYSTDIHGVLKFKVPPTVEVLACINEISGQLPRDLQDIQNPDNAKSYIQWELTKDFKGIKWDDGEKFYDIVETMNLLIATCRTIQPDFELEGEMLCQGEDIKDRWKLLLNEKGFAYRQDSIIEGLVKCPACDHQWVKK